MSSIKCELGLISVAPAFGGTSCWASGRKNMGAIGLPRFLRPLPKCFSSGSSFPKNFRANASFRIPDQVEVTGGNSIHKS